MGKVRFLGEAAENPVGDGYSAARGPVLRSDKMEVARVFFPGGEGAELHRHPEEQTVYVEEGRLEVTLDESDAAETYVVEAGQASFHGSNVPHRVRALEDTWAVSFKNLVDPSRYPATGRLE